jgi:hypothetical protein
MMVSMRNTETVPQRISGPQNLNAGKARVGEKAERARQDMSISGKIATPSSAKL